MSKNNRSSASDSGSTSVLSSLRGSKLGGRVASLIGSDDTDPEPRAFSSGATKRFSATVDRDRPDANTEDYWTEYKQNPIIATQIQSFASDVFEAGWWITADNEDTREEIEEYCHNIGIKAGKPHRSLTELGEQAIIQHQVRGTFLGEKVTDERGRHVAINPINVSTMEIYTKGGVNMLIPPDYKPESKDQVVKRDKQGRAAAYVQFDQQLSRWSDRRERKFVRDGVLHWARRPDLGDVFGNSRVEPVLERSRALREKLQDNDLAIAMKAWPMIMFQMGTEDRPWTLDQMEDFMNDYTEDELGPGMFQGVPGDIEVYEFAGETADIGEPVMTDVDMIVSAMPGPKHSTGSFPGKEGEPTEAYERQYMKLVRKMRMEFEELMTPYLKEVAESWGYDASGLELHVGRPDGEVAPEDIQGNIIRYEGVDDDEDDDSEDDIVDVDGGTVGEDSDTEPETDNDDDSGTEESSVDLNSVDIGELADPDFTFPDTAEELADSGRIGTDGIESEIGELIADVLIESRNGTMDVVSARYGSRISPDGDSVASEFETQVGSKSRSDRLVRAVRDSCDQLKDHTIDGLESESIVDVSPDVAHSSLSSAAAEKIISDVRDLANEMSIEIARSVENINDSGRTVDVVEQRVSGIYTDGGIQQRATLIAQMRLVELLNRIKLHEYRQSPDVDGVTISSNCGDDEHRVITELAGCNGDSATAYFENESEMCIAEQLADDISSDPVADFRPLAGPPPYHFGSGAEFKPIQSE